MNNNKSFQQLLSEQCEVIVKKVTDDMQSDEQYSFFINEIERIPVIRKPILYRWWFREDSEPMIALKKYLDEHPTDVEMQQLFSQLEERKFEGKEQKYYALYFGKSNNGYRRYIQHSTGNVHTSTLRHTLYGLCLTNNEESQYSKQLDKEEITRILRECYFEWLPFNEEGKLVECVEGICIALGKYPLNVDGNPAISDSWREYVMEKRKLKE
jgi:hypothetical protein